MRPAPAIVKAKKAEIARRYRRKRRHASRPQFAAIRISELNRLFAARYGGVLPDNEAGAEAIHIVAHHLIQLAGVPQARFANWAIEHAPWLTLSGMNAVLAEVVQRPQTWKADSLAWRLKLTYADRTTLKITTIGAVDFSAAKRKTLRRKRKKEAMRKLRERRRAMTLLPP